MLNPRPSSGDFMATNSAVQVRRLTYAQNPFWKILGTKNRGRSYAPADAITRLGVKFATNPVEFLTREPLTLQDVRSPATALHKTAPGPTVRALCRPARIGSDYPSSADCDVRHVNPFNKTRRGGLHWSAHRAYCGTRLSAYWSLDHESAITPHTTDAENTVNRYGEEPDKDTPVCVMCLRAIAELAAARSRPDWRPVEFLPEDYEAL